MPLPHESHHLLAVVITIGTDVISEGLVEMLDGQFETAEQVLREGYDWLRQRGAHTALAILAVMLARVHLRLGNDNQAQRFIEEAREVAVETQFDAQIKWRSLQALVEAARVTTRSPIGSLSRRARSRSSRDNPTRRLRHFSILPKWCFWPADGRRQLRPLARR
jgi:MalT-like TPR region